MWGSQAEPGWLVNPASAASALRLLFRVNVDGGLVGRLGGGGFVCFGGVGFFVTLDAILETLDGLAEVG
jgi:hypothetical protein